MPDTPAGSEGGPPPVSRLLDLSGRVALVTGAGSGLGTGIAARLAEAGAAVVVHCHRSGAGASDLARVIVSRGGRAIVASGDLTRPGEVARVLDLAADQLHQIYALSKGYPGLIHIICDHPLLDGYSANLQLIEGSVIRDCSRDLSVALDLEESLQAPPASPAAASAGSPAAAASVVWSGRPWLYLAAAVAPAGACLYYITG